MHLPFFASFAIFGSLIKIYVSEGITPTKAPTIYPIGIISRISGQSSGKTDNGISALNAKIDPYGISLDNTQSVYFADQTYRKIRFIDSTSGNITTVVGTGQTGSYYNGEGLAVNANLNKPTATFVTSNYLYIAEPDNFSILRVHLASKMITAIAGTGVTPEGSKPVGGYDNNKPALQTKIKPNSVFVDSNDNFLYFAEMLTHLVRQIDLKTMICTIVAGTGDPGTGGENKKAVNTPLYQPFYAIADNNGNIYISEQKYSRIRKVDKNTGNLTTIAGTGIAGPGTDNILATRSQVNYPCHLALDNAGNFEI